MSNSLKYDVIIVGAGAAGLMCAMQAGQRGRRVLLLDKANKPGKKILMSGGGRCNFTNNQVSHENYISHNPHFAKSALSRYTPTDFIELVEQYNIPYHEKTLGQLFCDNKSKDILNMLLAECEKYAVTIRLNTTINAIKKQDNENFILLTNLGRFTGESLVIASGGLSIPTMGASGFGYEIAKQFDINVWPTRAALVPFTLHKADKEQYAQLTGIAIDCEVKCNKTQFKEALLFTHRGLSGPAMLQISSYWCPQDSLTIDLSPHHNLLEYLQEEQQLKPNITLKTSLSQLFPKRYVALFLGDDLAQKALKNCPPKQLNNIAQLFHHWQIKPNGTEGYRTAEVTLGGVDCNDISSKTFQANNTPGLYFIGEVLDVTGWLGGYNFQWAWASGYAAGQVA